MMAEAGITIDRRDFNKAVKFASQPLERRNVIPVLGTVRVRANGSLTFEGSDLDFTARAELPYSGKAREFLLHEPGRLLKAINHSGAPSVCFSETAAKGEGAGKLHVTAGQLTADMPQNIPADDHPGAPPLAETAFSCTIGSEFFEQLARVRSAISTEETRYYLNGVFVHKIGDWLYRMVATDGHRLMVADVPLPDAAGDLPGNTILPRRFVDAVTASFGKAAEGIHWAIGRTMASNTPPNTLDPPISGALKACMTSNTAPMKLAFTGQLIDGTFPDYSRVVPTSWDFTLRIKRAELTRAVHALTQFASERVRAVRLVPCGDSGDQLRVELHSVELGKSSFTIDAEHRAPADYMIGFNGQYLLDSLAALKGDEVEMRMGDRAAPVTILDPADTAFFNVLMPMRI